jgi:hypothetical protein
VHRHPVDVLDRGDRLEGCALVDMSWYWVLQQDLVHGRLLGERRDLGDEFARGGRRGQLDIPRLHPDFCRPVALHPHVGMRRGIVAY